MAKRNNGELFDLKNLEQAKELVSQINYILTKPQTNNFEKDSERLVELYTELNKLANDNFNITKTQIRQRSDGFKEDIKNLTKLLQLQQTQIDKEEQLTTTTNDRINKLLSYAKTSVNNSNKNKSSSFNLDNIGSTILSNKIAQLEKQDNIRMESIVSAIIDKYEHEGKFDDNHMDMIQRDIDDALSNFNDSSSKLKLGAQALNVAGKVISDTISVITNLFKEGIDNQKKIYEGTFTNIAVRNDLSRSDYYSAQANVNNTLGSLGLRNNIATSEVQTMWNTLASNGIEVDLSNEEKRAEITSKAIETVLTNTVVPYLDMSSSYMQQLSSNNPYLMKQVRGIGTAIMNVENSNVVANKYLQDMLDNLSPMAELANEEIGVQYARSLGVYENLRSQGMSDSQIGEMYSQQKKLTEDPYAALQSNDVVLRYAAAQAIGNNADTNDTSETQRYLLEGYGLAKEVTQTWDPRQSNVGAGIVAGNWNLGISTGTLNTMARKDIDFEEALIKGNEAADKLDNAANSITNNFKSDKYQTNQRLQDVTLENLTNEWAVFEEWIGNGASIVRGAVEGVGSLIKTAIIGGVIGKGIGALSGLGNVSSTGGLFTSLGAAGPIALGVAAAGATVAAFYAWDKSIQQKNLKNDSEYTERSNELYNNYISAAKAKAKEDGTSESDIDENAIYGQALNDAQSRGNIGIWKNSSEVGLFKDSKGNYTTTGTNDYGILSAFTDLDKETRESFGLTPKALKTGGEEAKIALDELYKNKDFEAYNSIKSYALRSVLNNNSDLIKSSDLYAALSITYLLDNMNTDSAVVNPIKKYLGYDLANNKDDIQSFMDSNGITQASQLMDIYNMLGSKEVDFYLATSAGSFKAFPSENELKENFNLHRYGLDEVPYDNYPALLHEGEAVLTASTANEMRGLVDEYRDTNTQIADFDVIIQGQTTAILAKMDDIISAISNKNSYTPTSSSLNSINARDERLKSSMLKMISTRQFG